MKTSVTRRMGEKLAIGTDIIITIEDVFAGKVRLVIECNEVITKLNNKDQDPPTSGKAYEEAAE